MNTQANQTTQATNDRYSAVLRARCTPELKERLELFAAQHSLTRAPADHIRAAVEEYLEKRGADPADAS